MPRFLHIACLQTRPMPEMADAIHEAGPLVDAAARAGARMIFLPEYCGGYRMQGARVCPPSAPERAHPVLQAFRDAAAKHGVWINVGSLAVEGPKGKVINRGFMIDAAGQIFGRYDKIHLFDVDLGQGATFSESATVQPGSHAQVYDTPLGRIGHTICYDLRFPGLFRSLAQAGAEVIACPAAFTKKTGEAHWHVLNRARAIENTCFIVSACAVGPVPGAAGESYGHSLVVSPWGEVLSDGGDLPGIIHTQIDLDRVGETASRIPSLSHDRPYSMASDPERNVA